MGRGEYGRNCLKYNSFTRNISSRAPLRPNWYLDIFSFSLQIVPPLLEDVPAKNQLTKDEIDLFVFHQANGFMLEALRRKNNISKEKFLICMENTGNTVSATIPIALREAQLSGRIKKGDKVLIAGFGIGYSWGATILRF